MLDDEREREREFYYLTPQKAADTAESIYLRSGSMYCMYRSGNLYTYVSILQTHINKMI